MARIKPNNSTSSFILLFVFFIIAIGFMLVFLNLLSMKNKVDDNEETTTTNTVESKSTTTTVPVKKEFQASLKDILGDTELTGKYNIEVSYEDATFKFKCVTYNEKDDECISGSALMMIDDITFNLYTFASSNYDYSSRPNDYYVIVQDDYVMLGMNKAGIEPGVLKIYNRKGKNIKDIKDYISGYLNGEIIINMQYPTYNNGELSYYTCIKNKVSKYTMDLNDKEYSSIDEKIDNVTCY